MHVKPHLLSGRLDAGNCFLCCYFVCDVTAALVQLALALLSYKACMHQDPHCYARVCGCFL